MTPASPLRPFRERLLPAPRIGGFRLDDSWVWCGSVIRGEDGRYHMFASRWPKTMPFAPHWVLRSEIVRAVADTPQGPYAFAEVVLPQRDPRFWDGAMTHNPSIHRCGNTYLLFYTGTTYEGSFDADQLHDIPSGPVIASPLARQARANQRIGLATAASVCGPWQRRDVPVLGPRPGQWDGLMVTNPAPCVRDDGSVLLVYKSVAEQTGLMRLGVARASAFDGPYERIGDGPILQFDATGDHVEDAYVWWNRAGHRYEMIMKDMNGGICGERGAGVHGYSAEGLHWRLSPDPLAYSLSVRWDDGIIAPLGSFERPQLLIEAGEPTCLFAAAADGPGGYHRSTTTWNIAIPLR